jgi:RNA polymerase sigma factor for flagellar operon FliA
MLSTEMASAVEKYKSLADSIALSAYLKLPHIMDLDETKAQAYYGLCKAADRWLDYCDERGFDSEAVNYFEAFASRRIRGEIIDCHRKIDPATRTQRDNSKLINSAGHGIGADEDELVKETGLSRDAIRDTISATAKRHVSFEVLGEVSIPDRTDIEASHEESQILKTLVDFIQTELDYQEQIVLALHYYAGKELREIAIILEISESSASQLHTAAALAVRGVLVELLELPSTA